MRLLPRLAALACAGLLSLAGCVMAEPQPPAGTLTAEGAIADLDRLYAGLRSAEANLFVATPEAVFDARHAELRTQFDGPVMPADLHADLQRFAALARHAHTRIDSPNPGWSEYVEAGGKVFPLSLSVEAGEVIVTGAPEGSGAAPGDRLVSLEGEPNPIWLARLTRNISAETPAFAYAQMANAEPYYVWLEYGPRAQFSVEIERAGVREAVLLDAIPLEALSDLVTFEPGFSLPGRKARMLSADIAYLRPGGFFNLDATTAEEFYTPDALAAYESFVDAAFEDFIARGTSHLILDLRDNPGGDNSFSDPVIAWFADEPFRFASDFRIRVSPETTASNQARLDAMPEDTGGASAQLAALYAGAEPGELVSFELPYAQPRDGQRFEGEVHVLVNRYSYSNAVSMAALIQDYGFGMIYGEPTRDMATTYGAMEHFALPHSGFSVGYPKAHIIRPNGEEISSPVTPDVPLPVPAVRGARDVMLDALVARLARQNP